MHQSFKYSEIHKFKLSSAENQGKRKCALDNAQKAKKVKKAQQTRTLDLLKDLCKKNQKVMLEVFQVDEIGKLTILRPLSADEANTAVFKSLHPRSHHKVLSCSSERMAAFQLTFTPKSMNCLNKWQARSKLLPVMPMPGGRAGTNATDSDEELQSASKKDILGA